MVAWFEFSLKILTSVWVTVYHFRMGGGQFYRWFIIRVDYLFYYTKLFNRNTFFNFSVFTIIDRSFLLLHSWIIFLTSGTMYSILRMSSLFLHSRDRPLKSYYNKTTKRKCVTLSNLKLLLLCFFLFQLLNKIDIRKSRIKNLKQVSTISLPHLMRVIARAHASTRATSLMHVKNSTHHFCLWHLLFGTLEWKKWNKD